MGRSIDCIKQYLAGFLSLALTVRDKDHIALDLIYSWLPMPAAFAIQQFRSMIIFALGLISVVYGLEAAATMSGKYWQIWHFVWQDRGLVFKPHYMPKEYAIAIVPISGLLVNLAAGAAICEECLMFRSSTFKRSEDIEFVKSADEVRPLCGLIVRPLPTPPGQNCLAHDQAAIGRA